MELSNIEKLLEKYFEGETTISEEKELKVYFTRETVPSHLERYKDLFQYFSEESQVKATRGLPLQSGTKNSRYMWIGVAASVALVVGLFVSNLAPNQQENLGTYEDPEVALQKTKEVLNLVSQYMNEGKGGLVYLNEFENTKNKFIK